MRLGAKTMRVRIKETKQLKELQRRTGRPIERLVNEILEIHLDEKKKSRFLGKELDELFSLYKKEHPQVINE